MARLSTPSHSIREGVAVDSAGYVYVGDYGNHRIRKITPSGVASTLAGSGVRGFADGTGTTAKFSKPYGVAVDSAGNVYVVDYGNDRIRKITP
jgi:DNA-binding beta-propeller fold protein YncE